MKIKSLITFSLLFSLAFSMFHEYAIAFYDDDHCSISEYVSEIETPSLQDDICDTHFKYHQAFLLPQENHIQSKKHSNYVLILKNESYDTQTHLEFYKPPIS